MNNSQTLLLSRIQARTQILRNNTLELIKVIPFEPIEYNQVTRKDMKQSIENLEFLIPLLKSCLDTLARSRMERILINNSRK